MRFLGLRTEWDLKLNLEFIQGYALNIRERAGSCTSSTAALNEKLGIVGMLGGWWSQ
jgi:hypothetical protein